VFWLTYVRDKKLALAGAGSMVVFGASLGLVAIMLPEIGAHFGLDLAGRGLIGSAQAAATLLAVTVSGIIADRFGRRILLSFGAFAIFAGLFLAGVAPRYALFLVGAGCVGLGGGIFDALVSPLIVRMYPRDSAARLNAFHGCFSLGVLLAALSTILLYRGLSWQWAFLGAAPIALLVTGLFATGRYPAQAASHESFAAARGSLRRRTFWVLSAAMFLTTGAEIGITTWTPNFLKNALQATPVQQAVGFGAFAAAMLVGRLTVAKVVRRIGAPWVLLGSALAGILVILAATVSNSIVATIALFALAGLCQAGFWPTTLVYASRRLGDSSNTLFSLLAAFGMAGATVSPLLIGAMSDALESLRAGFASMAGFLALSAAIYAGFAAVDRRERRKVHDDER